MIFLNTTFSLQKYKQIFKTMFNGDKNWFFYVFSLFDGISNTIIARYEIERIMFYANGVSGTNEASCFAFSWAHGDTKENALFQCHVFRCSIPEAVCS